jgi:hypothetical protein
MGLVLQVLASISLTVTRGIHRVQHKATGAIPIDRTIHLFVPRS